jgi:hypothetical protein
MQQHPTGSFIELHLLEPAGFAVGRDDEVYRSRLLERVTVFCRFVKKSVFLLLDMFL